MEKRMILALVLTAAVVGLTPVLFPGAPAPARRADSTAVAPASAQRAPERAQQAAVTTPVPVAASPVVTSVADSVAIVPAARADSSVVTTDLATYRFVDVGAAP